MTSVDDSSKIIRTSAFVGEAGTGKSQRALLVSSLLDADYIIDDGLVIYKGSIVCGKSAKSERNRISAIRRALFEFDDHRKEVRKYFSSLNSYSVMVIATSDSMACKILKNLAMPAPSQIVHIEDVATPEEILRAREERYGKGQHVIPVSQVLVRRNFAGKLVGQLRVFWKSKDRHEGEKTIVRPPFSFFGSIHVEPEAIEQLVSFVACRTTQVGKIIQVDVLPEEEGIMSMKIKIAVRLGTKKFPEVAELVKERVSISLRYFTGFDVREIDVIVAEVQF